MGKTDLFDPSDAITDQYRTYRNIMLDTLERAGRPHLDRDGILAGPLTFYAAELVAWKLGASAPLKKLNMQFDDLVERWSTVDDYNVFERQAIAQSMENLVTGGRVTGSTAGAAPGAPVVTTTVEEGEQKIEEVKQKVKDTFTIGAIGAGAVLLIGIGILILVNKK